MTGVLAHHASATTGYVIKNVTTVDGVHGARSDVDVVVIGGTIAAVGSNAAESASHSSLKKIDANGKYLTPGLWDAHAHVGPKLGRIDYRTFFPLAIAHGITSLRDTGGDLDGLAAALAIAQSDPQAPDLYVAGPLLDGPRTVYPGDGSVAITSAEQAVQKIDELAAVGVDFVKLYEMVSAEVFGALAARAHHHKLRIVAHAPLSVSSMEVVESGPLDMQHLRNLELGCVANADPFVNTNREMIAHSDPEQSGMSLRTEMLEIQRRLTIPLIDEDACDAYINAMVENGISQTPTLTVARFFTRRLYADDDWRETFSLIPEANRNDWLERATALSKQHPDEHMLAYDRWAVSMVPRMAKAGVTILAGTDSPVGFLTPGVSLHKELELLVDAGLTPLQAIYAATIAPARFFNLDHKQGSIAEGMKADLVLLAANPLDDITNVGSIEAVFKDGFFIDRSALDALLAAPALLND